MFVREIGLKPAALGMVMSVKVLAGSASWLAKCLWERLGMRTLSAKVLAGSARLGK